MKAFGAMSMFDPLLLVLYIYSSEETIRRSCTELVLVFCIRMNFTTGDLQYRRLNTKIIRGKKALKRYCRKEGNSHTKPLWVCSNVITCQIEKGNYKPAFLHFEVGRRKFIVFFCTKRSYHLDWKYIILLMFYFVLNQSMLDNGLIISLIA